MMEKRVLLAALLSAIFLAWYSQLVTKRYTPLQSPQAQDLQQTDERQPSTVQDPPTMQAMATSTYPLDDEAITLIDSQSLTVEIGQSSGAVRRVTLKEFLDEAGEIPLEIASGFHLFHLQIGERPMTWSLVSSGLRRTTLEAEDTQGNLYHLSYVLDEYNPVIDIELSRIKSAGSGGGQLVMTSSWTRADELGGRFNMMETVALTEDTDGKQKYWKSGPTKKTKIVPRGTILLSLGERYFCQSLRADSGATEVTVIPSPEGTIMAQSRIDLDELTVESSRQTMSIYVGPRDYFRLKEAGFDGAFKIGILGQIGLMLLSALSLIAGVTKNYGVAIVLLSTGITCLMSPFTMLSMRSMKKMQELKPQIDRIMAQAKKGDQAESAKANQKVFALYKEHRVSPVSSCLPMLLQMPIFIAMFYAISHYVELRGQSFLWIRDLSLPDRLAELPFSIPLLGSYFNLLPVIMAGAMFFQTKMSQGKMASDSTNPAAKMMSGPMMPIIFGAMFYQFPSGLVLYWLTNTLVSLIWYKAAK